MDRRTLLKTLGVASLTGYIPAASIGATTPITKPLGLPSVASPDWKLDPTFSSANYFEPIQFRDGELPIFPLDLLTGDMERGVSATDYLKCYRSVEANEIAVPIFDIGFDKAKTNQEAIDGLQKKINLHAAQVLYYSAYYSNVLFYGIPTRKKLDATMNVHLRRVKAKYPSSVKYKSFTYGPYVIGVDLASDVLVMPIRNKPEVFLDANKEFYSFTSMGMACLSCKAVTIGVIL